MDRKIRNAQEASRHIIRYGKGSYYQAYHLVPPTGWMNDPNGLIYHKGVYHAFYQHHPYSARWGPMHWGHATSSDMVHWRHQPVALAPGNDEDRDGCFSGSAVDDNGVLSLIYTGHVKLEGEGDSNIIREVQCLATSKDGIHFKKQGVVLNPPPGIMHFRDPRVWFQNGSWWMVVGVRDENSNGQAYLYRGKTLRDWVFDRVLALSGGDMGYMWECPDFFPLGNEYILMFSPQGIQARYGYTRRNLYQSGYIRGTWQPGSDFHIRGPFTEMDCGHDFYAPQSFLAADGRRIIMAWMDMWASPMPSQKEGWSGSLTLPREIRLNSRGEIRIQPVAELAVLRKHGKVIPSIILDNTTRKVDRNVIAQEIHLQWDRNRSTAERYGVRLGRDLSIWMDNQSRRLVLERQYSDVGLSGYRSVALADSDFLSLQLFFDRSSVEVFVNDGQATLSSRIYPSPSNRVLTLFADAGQAVMTGGKRWILKADRDQENE